MFDVLIDSSRIIKISKNIEDKDSLVIDAEGKSVVPGLVDVHVHLRQPDKSIRKIFIQGHAPQQQVVLLLLSQSQTRILL